MIILHVILPILKIPCSIVFSCSAGLGPMNIYSRQLSVKADEEYNVR